MDCKVVDERLIRRGEPLLSLEFVGGYYDEFEAMSYGKVGRPFKFTRTYITFLAVVRFLFSIPYSSLKFLVTRKLNPP